MPSPFLTAWSLLGTQRLLGTQFENQQAVWSLKVLSFWDDRILKSNYCFHVICSVLCYASNWWERFLSSKDGMISADGEPKNNGSYVGASHGQQRGVFCLVVNSETWGEKLHFLKDYLALQSHSLPSLGTVTIKTFICVLLSYVVIFLLSTDTTEVELCYLNILIWMMPY